MSSDGIVVSTHQNRWGRWMATAPRHDGAPYPLLERTNQADALIDGQRWLESHPDLCAFLRGEQS